MTDVIILLFDKNNSDWSSQIWLSNCRLLPHLDVPVHNLVLVQVPQPLQDLSGVKDDGGLLQRTPFGPQQRRKASWGEAEPQ